MSDRHPIEHAASVDAAILSRMSARAFLPQAVSRATLEHILSVASRAPSGTNTQPWKVYVLQGERRDSLVDGFLADIADGDGGAFVQEFPRRRETDALRAAGDDGDLALQTLAHCLLPLPLMPQKSSTSSMYRSKSDSSWLLPAITRWRAPAYLFVIVR